MSDELIFVSRQVIPPAYIVEDLGLLPEGRLSHAVAINLRGDVVGDADSDSGMRAFLWSDGVMTDLGTLGGSASRAIGINSDGQVIGMAERQAGGRLYPFLHQDGRMIDLETHGMHDVMSLGAIDDHGAIAGTISTAHVGDNDIRSEKEVAFCWTYGSVTELGDPGIQWSEALGMNATGMIVGELHEPTIDRSQAFVWSPQAESGRLIALGTGAALDINDKGVVAGYVAMSDTASAACIWSDHVRRDIPMPFGTVYSKANAINGRGDVVGIMGESKTSVHPFLWSRGHLIDLNDTIDPQLGWTLRDASDINDAGQIIGWGFRNHRHHAYRMTPNAAG